MSYYRCAKCDDIKNGDEEPAQANPHNHEEVMCECCYDDYLDRVKTARERFSEKD